MHNYTKRIWDVVLPLYLINNAENIPRFEIPEGIYEL